jgi:hypothetical protein
MSEFLSIRNRDNVKKNGEVFTPDDKVTDMLNLIPTSFWCDRSACIIEPTCGNGQFLIQCFDFKVKNGLNAIEALNTIIGMDISTENIAESHTRLYKRACNWMLSQGITVRSKEWKILSVQIVAIVRNNIIKVKDSLKVIDDYGKGKGKLVEMKFVFSDPTGNYETMNSTTREKVISTSREDLNAYKTNPTQTFAPFYGD